MKIYRGPKSRTTVLIDEDSHEQTDNRNLSVVPAWHNVKSIRDLNISKGAARFRKSTVDIDLNESDVIALHSSLMNGLRTRVTIMEQSHLRLVGILRAIRDAAKPNTAMGSSDSLKQIYKLAGKAQGVLSRIQLF